MGRVTTRKRIHKVTSTSARSRVDYLAVEEPLEMRIGGTPFVVTMRTPGNDVELATGFLFSEGVITRGDQVHEAMHCGGPSTGNSENTYNVLALTLTVPAPPARGFTTTSACGVCGKDSIESVHTTRVFDPGDDHSPLDLDVLASLPGRLREHQEMFKRTGGTHAAGLFTYDGDLIVAREDVGRHNAVDKVIGWALLNDRLPLARTVLQVSGRASFELVQKAAVAGIPAFGAVSAPSSLAVDLAEESGITLAGFMRGETMNIYTHGHRLGDFEE